MDSMRYPYNSLYVVQQQLDYIYQWAENLDEGLSGIDADAVKALIDSVRAEMSEISGEVQGLRTSKQDRLAFDSEPTEGSTNPVTSGGVWSAIDSAIPENVYSKRETDALLAQKQPLGDYATTEQLEDKQDALTFDSTPTAGSLNPVTSEGIKAAIDAIEPAPVDAYTKAEADALLATKQPKGEYATGEQLVTVNSTLTQHAQEIAGNAADIAGLDADKQDKLTFDTEPTEGSLNPVTSDGIKKAIAAGGGGALDATPTAGSMAGVQSGGVYAWSNPTPWGARDEVSRTRPPTSKALLEILGVSRSNSFSISLKEKILVNGEIKKEDLPRVRISGQSPEAWKQGGFAFVARNNYTDSDIKNITIEMTQNDTIELVLTPAIKYQRIDQAYPITVALVTLEQYNGSSFVIRNTDAYLPTPYFDENEGKNGQKFIIKFSPTETFDRIIIKSVSYRYELSSPSIVV